MLELGKGFCFFARRKRIRFEEQDFYIDLVFYNCILKCYVLIDLKLGELAYQDIGQMDGYIRLYEERYRKEDDNPALGSMLNFTRCSIRCPPLFRMGPSPAELDRRAQHHFDGAKATIPKIAEKLSTLESLSRMCWYMATNKPALQNFFRIISCRFIGTAGRIKLEKAVKTIIFSLF